MTPDELRQLAAAATPGPWTISNPGIDGEDAIGGISIGEDDFIETDGGFYGPRLRNARLIALAPDLARLCAELGEALAACLQYGTDEDDRQWVAIDPRGTKPAQVALAKLSELESSR